MKLPGLTPAQTAALDYIGNHRKTDVKVGPGKPISQRMFNTLEKKRLVMWLNESKKTVMLTYPGERMWTKLHPTSKYRIK